MTVKLQMTCSNCGSSNVARDASARWDVESQTWEAGDPYDNADCDNCGETRIEEVPVDLWAIELMQPREFEGYTLQAFEKDDGDWRVEVTDDAGNVHHLDKHPEIGWMFGDAEEALDGGRVYVLRRNAS